MVWVRGDAMASQGPAAAAQGGPAGGDFFTGPVLEQNRESGAAGAPGGPVQTTLLTVAGCYTRWFICPPHTIATRASGWILGPARCGGVGSGARAGRA